MNRRVGGVDKLAGNEAVRRFRRQLLRLGDGALHALCPFGKHQLRAIGLHQLAALHAHGFRHDNDDAIAPGSRHGGKTDAGVAGGRLDDDGTGLQLAAGLRIVDHGLCNAVFHTARGIEVFQLAQNPGLQSFFLLNVAQFQQRGLSDQLIGGSINIAHSLFLL